MRKLIIYLFGLLLFTPAACQNKNDTNKNMQQDIMFDWQEGTAAPLGFPMQVYQGGLTAMDGYTSLDHGPITGYWGQPGSGMSSGRKLIPKLLHVKWLSFAERCFYEVDVELDYDRMLQLFKDGYYVKVGALGIQKKTYNKITVGFAPGGVVVVWLSGLGRQTDVGRYQGKKVTIPQAEINKLDSDRAYMFKESDWQETVDIVRTNLNNDKKNNPEGLNLKKKMDDEPIPFGIWDTYREKYDWKPVYNFQSEYSLDNNELSIGYFNGELEEILSKDFVLQENGDGNNIHYSLNRSEKRPIPTDVSFGYLDKNGVMYGAAAIFNQNSVINAFNKIFVENSANTNAVLIIKINLANTFFTVELKGNNGQDILIATDRLQVYKVKK